MHRGMQIEALNGLEGLRADTRYYVVHMADESVLLVWFERREAGWRVFYMRVSRELLVTGLQADPPQIAIMKHQLTVPPWLEHEAGLNYDELEEDRAGRAKESYREQTTRRLFEITPALEQEQENLLAINPLRAITKKCKSAGTKVHPHRLCLWFFAYILHGYDLWSLKRPAGGVGQWNRRSDPHRNKKLGRPSLSGRSYGWSTALMRDEILNAYLKYSSLGKSMRAIHRDALEHSFKCIVVKDAVGQDVLIQPDNKPFPSYGQFRYVVVSQFGLGLVQKTLYGAARIRRSAAADEGNYSSQYAYLLESFEIDAYVVDDRPKSLWGEQTMPALYVVRGRCPTSGAVVGVGFGLGSETTQAYRGMLLCAALPKSLVARLYGLDPKMLDWEMSGLPPSVVSDRGPGGTDKLIRDFGERPQMKTIVPSYQGQSKPFVESANPRSVKIDGAPSFVQSALTVPEMMKREILEAVRMNKLTSMTNRLTNAEVYEFRMRGWYATPQNLWKYRTEQLRSSAHFLSVEQAVRRFAEPCLLDVDQRGVRFRTHWYSSAAFRESGVTERLRHGGDLKVSAYYVPMALLIIWVEVGGKLLELEPLRTIRVGMEEFDLTVSELEFFADERRRLDSDTRVGAEAAGQKARSDFQAATLKSWSEGERRGGTPKRARGTVAVEADIIRGRAHGTKAKKRA